MPSPSMCDIFAPTGLSANGLGRQVTLLDLRARPMARAEHLKCDPPWRCTCLGKLQSSPFLRSAQTLFMATKNG